jgi:hypothetical protein
MMEPTISTVFGLQSVEESGWVGTLQSRPSILAAGISA